MVAALAFILTLIFGKQISTWFATVSATIIVMPILVVFTFVALGMLNADPEAARAIASSTVEEVVSYFADKLPDIVISDLAGAIVGTVGGFVLGIAKGS